MTMKNITAKIKHYHPVCDEALHAMLSEMTVMHCPKNTTIVHSGRIDRNVYFVEEGLLVLFSTRMAWTLQLGSVWKVT